MQRVSESFRVLSYATGTSGPGDKIRATLLICRCDCKSVPGGGAS